MYKIFIYILNEKIKTQLHLLKDSHTVFCLYKSLTNDYFSKQNNIYLKFGNSFSYSSFTSAQFKSNQI